MRRLWEATTGTALLPDHRRLFDERPEAAALGMFPRMVVEKAASDVFQEHGELRLPVWLEASRLQRRADPPLKIEMVPSTCWWSNLRSELPDEQWTVCKRWSSARAGRRCEACGEKGPKWPVECHEQWACLEDQRPRVQRLDGLISLCPACHESTHMGFATTRGRDGAAMEHLAAVNGWESQRAAAYRQACEQLWLSRSQHEWSLDVSWLTSTLGIPVQVRRQGPPV